MSLEPCKSRQANGWSRQSLLRIAIAAIVLALVALAGFGRLTRHPGDLLVGTQREGRNDLTDAFLAYRQFPQASAARFGSRGAWNPFSMAGRPWVGNPQSALHYPLHWLTDRTPTAALLSWVMVWHHFWGGLGVYFLCRIYGLERGALVGGAVFLLAPYWVAQTGEGHFNQVILVAWVPWTLMALERLRRAGRGGVSLLALMLGLSICCGHVQESVYLGVVLAGLVLVDVVQAFRSGRRREAIRLARRFAGACLLAAGIAAVEWIAAWLYIQQSVREAGVSAAESAQYAVSFANLGQLLYPFFLGPPEAYRGPDGAYWETLCYVGVIPLALAVGGAVAGWRSYPTARMIGVWLIGLAFAFGPNLPLYPWLCAVLPPLSMFRVPGRALFFVALAVSVLAAVGVDRLARFAGHWNRHREVDGDRCRVGGGLAVLIAATLLVVCTGELSYHAWRILDTVAPESIRQDSPVVSVLAERSSGWRILADGDRLSDREAWNAGLQRFQSYEPVPLLIHAVLFDALSGRTDVMLRLLGFLPTRIEDCEPALLDMLAVRFVAAPDSSDPPPPGWRKLAAGQMPAEFTARGRLGSVVAYAIYENLRALPRAYVVGQARLGQGAGEVELLRSIDPRAEILVHQDPLPPGPRAVFRPATIVQDLPDRIVIDASASGPGFLFLSDTWYPGWRAEVDGRSVPVLRANIAFRAVPLNGGEHRVTFRYEPPVGRLAAWISRFSLLIVVILWIWPSRSSGPTDDPA